MTFRRQVITTLYQNVDGFSVAFSDDEAVDYLRALFEDGFLLPPPSDMRTLVSLIYFVFLFLFRDLRIFIAYPWPYHAAFRFLRH